MECWYLITFCFVLTFRSRNMHSCIEECFFFSYLKCCKHNERYNFLNITSTDAIYEYVNDSRTSGRNSHEYQRNRIVNLHIATVNVQLTRDTCMLQVTWQLTFIVFLQYLEVLRRNLRRELQGGSTTQLCARESNGTTSFPFEQLKQKKTSELNIN